MAPDIFGVTKTRTTSELLEGWRDNVDRQLGSTLRYLLLERSCREMMELYGYRRVMQYQNSDGRVNLEGVNSVKTSWTPYS